METIIDAFLAMVLVWVWLLILLIPLIIVYFVGLWKVFKKAERNGWEAIVPFYNTWVLSEISGTAWWYALIIIGCNLGVVSENILSSIISLAAIVSNFFIFYNLSKKFHQGVSFAILMTFFPWIMIPILGFSSKYQYDRNVIVSENGPVGENNQGTSYNAGHNTYYSNISDDRIRSAGNRESITNNKNESSRIQYCHYCGNQVNSDSKYCGNCGSEIK